MTASAKKKPAKAPVLSAAAILAANDREVRDVDVPEWGGSIRLRAWSAADMTAYETMVPEDSTGGVDDLAAALVLSAIGEDGQPLFTPDDIPALVQKSGPVLLRVGKTVLEMNKLGGAGLDAAKGN